MNSKSKWGGGWILIGPILIWGLAFALPISSVLTKTGMVPKTMMQLISSPYYRGIIGLTFKQAGLSTLFAVILGLPGAYMIGRLKFPGRRLLKSIGTIPFVLPSILVVLGFILVFGNSGLVNSLLRLIVSDADGWKILYSLRAIVMAHVFYNFPITLRVVGNAWSSLPRNTYLASRSLGASPIRAFFSVDFPRLAPAILNSAVITFLYCFLSFAVIIVLGGGPQLSTLEVEIFRLTKYQFDLSGPAALAIIETTFTVAIILALGWTDSRLRRRNLDDSPAVRRELERISTGKLIAISLYLLPIFVLILTPLLSIICYSFLARSTRAGTLALSLNHWRDLLHVNGGILSVSMLSIIRTMLLGSIVAINSTINAALVSWYTTRKKRAWILDALMVLPLGVSSIILGLGYLIVIERIPHTTMIRLMTLIGAHTIIALPFAYRIVAGGLKTISPRVLQAARSSGANTVKSFLTVELPMAKQSLITAAVFSLALSAGELSASIILAPNSFTTIPMAIYRMIGTYNIFAASALGAILICIFLIGFLAIDRIGDSHT